MDEVVVLSDSIEHGASSVAAKEVSSRAIDVSSSTNSSNAGSPTAPSLKRQDGDSGSKQGIADVTELEVQAAGEPSSTVVVEHPLHERPLLQQQQQQQQSKQPEQDNVPKKKKKKSFRLIALLVAVMKRLQNTVNPKVTFNKTPSPVPPPPPSSPSFSRNVSTKFGSRTSEGAEHAVGGCASSSVVTVNVRGVATAGPGLRPPRVVRTKSQLLFRGIM